MDAGKSRYGFSGSAKHLNRGTDAERIEQLAERMLPLNAQSPGNTPHEQAARSRQIAATDHEIDPLVYELYGLTDDEIRIVQEATAGDGTGNR
jgi:hypothetical protein